MGTEWVFSLVHVEFTSRRFFFVMEILFYSNQRKDETRLNTHSVPAAGKYYFNCKCRLKGPEGQRANKVWYYLRNLIMIPIRNPTMSPIRNPIRNCIRNRIRNPIRNPKEPHKEPHKEPYKEPHKEPQWPSAPNSATTHKKIWDETWRSGSSCDKNIFPKSFLELPWLRYAKPAAKNRLKFNFTEPRIHIMNDSPESF